MGFHVYILCCADNTLYCGQTNDLQRRLQEHNLGRGGRYTRCRLPVKLGWSMKCESRADAMAEERRIKKLSRKEKLKLSGVWHG